MFDYLYSLKLSLPYWRWPMRGIRQDRQAEFSRKQRLMVPAVVGDEGDDRSGSAMTGCGRMMDEMVGHDGNSNELKKIAI